jgi:carboxypeptidase C (cathepsin A)
VAVVGIAQPGERKEGRKGEFEDDRVTNPRTHGNSPKKQVAGYVVSYDNNLTFATVKGAGHMVPEYRPTQAWTMMAKFLNNEPLAV